MSSLFGFIIIFVLLNLQGSALSKIVKSIHDAKYQIPEKYTVVTNYNFDDVIDIFNPVQKHLFEKIIYDKYISIQNKILEQLYSCLRKLDLSLRWTNLYLYKDVCWPRPLHIDTNNIQIKVFLPCMDILDLRQGPYSYVPYSHKWQYVHRLNQKYNKIFNSDLGADNYDSTFFSSSMALPLFADKRSIIITMQNGIHGDLVAETGYGKNLFVWAFHPSGLF